MIYDGAAEERLDRAFAALADPIRRAIIARLSRGPATVNELAEPFQISKQAVSKHIQLEQADFVTRTRDAQRRPVHLNPGRLEALGLDRPLPARPRAAVPCAGCAARPAEPTATRRSRHEATN